MRQPVLVTGATGFLGQHLARRLLKEGAHLSLLVRNIDKLPSDLKAHCRVVSGDLLNQQALESALAGVHYVFHCAANVATWAPWHAYAEANVQGIATLFKSIEGSKHNLRRIVHLSTLDVYGFPVSPANEEAALSSIPFGYSETKRLGDLAVQTHSQRMDLSYTILRPGNIVGAGSPFVSRIGEALCSGLMLTVDHGRAHAGLLDVDNLVDAILWAGISPQAHRQIYNLRDPWDISWRDYIQDLKQGLSAKGMLINLPYPVATTVARSWAAAFSLVKSKNEPILHPLIIQIFGRTCGHSIEKILSHGAPIGKLSYQESLQKSIAWFIEKKISKN